MNKNKKIFVIDTNVILHDYECIFKFEENDVVLPIVTLEELDKFKKGNEQINYNAREFTRQLDQLSRDEIFNGGISLGEGKGNLSIETVKGYSEKLKKSFPEDNPDHKILSIAEHLKQKNKNSTLILVSKDINLRMKAKALSIMSQDYLNDKVKNINSIFDDNNIIENVDDENISSLFQETSIDIEKLNLKEDIEPNKYFILKGNDRSALSFYNSQENQLELVSKKKVKGIDPRNAEQAFSIDALLRNNLELVALTGRAGTGKTLLALAAAIQQEKQYNQIYLARPIVPLANRDLGYLPGDVSEKIDPYMQPLFDNFDVIKNKFKPESKEYKKIDNMYNDGKLVISPLTYIRGRSLSNIYFIVDEAQNLTQHEIKTIITRIGEGSKIVFTGDIEQIDSPYLDSESNGLSYLIEKMKGQQLFSHVNLIKGERSYLAELASNIL